MSNQNKGDEAKEKAFQGRVTPDVARSVSFRQGYLGGYDDGFDAGQRAKALEIAGELEEFLDLYLEARSDVLRNFIEKLKENENG